MRFSETKTLWNEWEIRVLVLASLFLQLFLISLGGVRKRNVSATIGLLLWLFYLMADSIAIYALGYLSHNQDMSGVPDNNPHLRAFWAPFLLLHLGGQDTITSFAIEDNELWTRQLLNLGSQIVLAVYVFSKSLLLGTTLLVPGILMFVAGIVKYGERVWSLKSASMDSLRNSMVTPPDPGPNYAKFMEVYSSSKAAGLNADIIVEGERPPDVAVTVGGEDERVEYSRLVSEAHGFFKTFRRLVVNLILSFQDRTKSQSFFLPLRPEQAYKVVELELSLLYDILHTKAALIRTVCGRLLRCTTVLSTLAALVLFTVRDKDRYDRIDVLVTYVLFGGALGLEIYASGLILFSYWTYVEAERFKCRWFARATFVILKFFRPEKRHRWSNLMAQYNLITYCLRDQPTCLSSLASFVGAKQYWDKFWYTEQAGVSPELKELIFRELKNKAKSIEDVESYRRFGEHRGQWALQRKGYYKEFGWSVEAEFDESILLWHIATDLCFNDNDVADASSLSHLPATSRAISNYMLFLLVMRPYMLTAGIGQIRFSDTCAEAKNFFLQGQKVLLNKIYVQQSPFLLDLTFRTSYSHISERVLMSYIQQAPDERGATKMILDVKTEIAPTRVKGDRSKSVLFDACRLAKGLTELPAHKRWKLIGVVWAEMLCYAASKCRGNFHAKQLSMGGELLTVVWLLTAHMGIGEQYRVEAGHARAKLIVEN